MAYFAEDFVFEEDPVFPEAGVYYGAEEFTAYAQAFLDMWQGFELELEELVVRGDRVLGLVRWRLKGKGSGVPVEMPIAHLWTFRDGEAVHMRGYVDREAARAALDGGAIDAVRAGGLEIAYRRAGEGPPLVFVHGAAGDGRMWEPQLAALAGDFTVLAWDEPGAVRSSDLPADFGLAGYADCLAALIETLDLGAAHVAGLSWGGTVALELYRRHPGLVATLIFADSYAGWKGSLPEDEVRARVAGLRRMLESGSERFDPTLPGLFAAGPPPRFAALLEEVTADVRPETLGPQLTIMANTDQRDLLPRVAVPTQLIWGELDERSPLFVARQFEDAIPESNLVVIPGCGHVSNLERPEEFNEIVREFCRAHPLTT